MSGITTHTDANTDRSILASATPIYDDVSTYMVLANDMIRGLEDVDAKVRMPVEVKKRKREKEAIDGGAAKKAKRPKEGEESLIDSKRPGDEKKQDDKKPADTIISTVTKPKSHPSFIEVAGDERIKKALHHLPHTRVELADIDWKPAARSGTRFFKVTRIPVPYNLVEQKSHRTHVQVNLPKDFCISGLGSVHFHWAVIGFINGLYEGKFANSLNFLSNTLHTELKECTEKGSLCMEISFADLFDEAEADLRSLLSAAIKLGSRKPVEMCVRVDDRDVYFGRLPNYWYDYSVAKFVVAVLVAIDGHLKDHEELACDRAVALLFTCDREAVVRAYHDAYSGLILDEAAHQHDKGHAALA
jgi:hypothetical protein